MKLFTSLIALIITCSYLHAQIPTEGLLACYSFENSTVDAINSFDGTLLGSASVSNTLNVGGNDQDALSLPGEVLDGATEFTVSCRVYFEEFNVNNQASANSILSSSGLGQTTNLINLFYVKDQLPGGAGLIQNTMAYLQGNQRYEFNDVDLLPQTWYHFTLVKGTESVKFYLDGIQIGPTSGVSVPPISISLDPNGFIFGQDQDVVGGGFEAFQSLNGSLDDLLIYNRTLNDEEVETLFNIDHSTLSVKESRPDIVRIFPNPVSDYLNVRFDGVENSITSIVAIDPTGKTVRIAQNLSQTLDVSLLSSGVYLLELSTANGERFLTRFYKN